MTRLFTNIFSKRIATLMAFGGVAFGLASSGAIAADSSVLFMQVAEPTSRPAGHVYYCENEPSACDRYGQGTVVLNEKTWQQLVAVNANVNQSIRSTPDGNIDQWSVYVKQGDCEDFALTKQRELMRLGWPSDSLLITTAYLPDNTYHAVLLVRTDRGEFVLDNLNPMILSWRDLDYRWNKRQAVGNPKVWQRIASVSVR